MSDSMFPPGTPVCVRQTIAHRDSPIHTEVVGVVESWEEQPTGSWFAHDRGGRLQLHRLKLRKKDGELVVLVIDDATEIARLEAESAS